MLIKWMGFQLCQNLRLLKSKPDEWKKNEPGHTEGGID